MKENDFKNYDQFWLFYLGQHAKRGTKLVHTVGLFIGFAIAGYGIYSELWLLLPAAVVITYGILWASHFLIEKNVPTTFRWPVWSFFSEFRLVWRTLTGRI